MLSMMESEGICISYISMSWPSGVNYMFFGDIGYQCDADGYPSDLIVDADGYKPKCIWLDSDKISGLRYQGICMHITDFYVTPERVEEYNKIKDKSTPRLQMYPNEYLARSMALVLRSSFDLLREPHRHRLQQSNFYQRQIPRHSTPFEKDPRELQAFFNQKEQ